MKKTACLLFLLLLSISSPARAWDETVQENVLVFDSEGEFKAGYHTGNWSRQVTADGSVVTYENWTAGSLPDSPPEMIGGGTASVSLEAGETAVPNMTGRQQPDAALGCAVGFPLQL